jgi:hypothetical protein
VERRSKAGLSRGLIAVVVVMLGFGAGYASSAEGEAISVTPQVLSPELEALASEIEARYANDWHPVPDEAGNIAGWVRNETIDAEPAARLQDLGEVYDEGGNVIAYYDTLVGVIDKGAVESGTFDLAAAQDARMYRIPDDSASTAEGD